MAEHEPARFFEGVANPRHALIDMPALAVRLVERMDGGPATRGRRDRRDVVNVIEVAVGEQDSADRETGPAAPVERATQGTDAADEAGVDQVEFVAVTQDMKANPGASNLEEIVTHGVGGHGGV